MHLLIFLNLVDEFSKASYIDEFIYVKLLTIEFDSIDKLSKIVTSVILYSLCRKINPHLP